MSEEKVELEKLEEVIVKLKDIHNSYIALVKKMAVLLTEIQGVEINSIAQKLDKPFSNASNNAKLLEQIVADVEIERNKIKSEAR